jgi:hypothetical protein
LWMEIIIRLCCLLIIIKAMNKWFKPLSGKPCIYTIYGDVNRKFPVSSFRTH